MIGKFWLRLVLFCGICLLFAIILFLNLGPLVGTTGENRPTDYVFCSTGSDGRILYAVDRIRRGESRILLLTGPYDSMLPLTRIPQIHFIASRVRELLGPGRIQLVGHSTSTYEDGLNLKRFLASATGTVLVTTDYYNLRRVRYIFRKVLRALPPERLGYYAAPASFTGLSPRSWLSRERDFLYVYSEALKFLYYFFKYQRI